MSNHNSEKLRCEARGNHHGQKKMNEYGNGSRYLHNQVSMTRNSGHNEA
jgi:hypothetical protein